MRHSCYSNSFYFDRFNMKQGPTSPRRILRTRTGKARNRTPVIQGNSLSRRRHKTRSGQRGQSGNPRRPPTSAAEMDALIYDAVGID